jgi:hypothetical protein
MQFDFNFDDHPINTYFDQNGFQSLLIIKNLGSTLFFIFFYFISLLMLLFFKIASLFIDKHVSISKKLESKLIWNGTIIMIL